MRYEICRGLVKTKSPSSLKFPSPENRFTPLGFPNTVRSSDVLLLSRSTLAIIFSLVNLIGTPLDTTLLPTLTCILLREENMKERLLVAVRSLVFIGNDDGVNRLPDQADGRRHYGRSVKPHPPPSLTHPPLSKLSSYHHTISVIIIIIIVIVITTHILYLETLHLADSYAPTHPRPHSPTRHRGGHSHTARTSSPPDHPRTTSALRPT
jgi:hypothetical protein